MRNNKLYMLSLVLAGALFAFPIMAVAEDVENVTPAAAKKMVKAMEENKTTLSAAIQTAEESCKGRAVLAHCELEKHKLVMSVYCLAGEKLMDIDVDARSGKVAESKEIVKQEGKAGKPDTDDDEITPAMAWKIVKALDESKTSLSAAIKIAEESCKGKAVLAHGELEEGKLVIAVFCLAGDKLMDIDIDVKTGKVIESEEAAKDGDKGEKKDGEKPKKP